MSWFHVHKWVTISVTHTPPSTFRVGRVEGLITIETVIGLQERLAKGMTHVVLRCEVCGDLKYRELAGVHPLEAFQTANAAVRS